jgi:hypothetical protein
MVLALFCAASVSPRLGRSVAVYECAMLQATLDEVGGTKYIVGNWAMHYYPFLRISLSGTVDYRTAGAVRQHLAAIAIIVVRVHFFKTCLCIF